jgi:hypothetical protein
MYYSFGHFLLYGLVVEGLFWAKTLIRLVQESGGSFDYGNDLMVAGVTVLFSFLGAILFAYLGMEVSGSYGRIPGLVLVLFQPAIIWLSYLLFTTWWKQ